ncbi:MAG: hypothetical protein C0401_04020 [Anaerolinea sp.]|nr:hypothetical protein [Anaerolinea sp.]
MKTPKFRITVILILFFICGCKTQKDIDQNQIKNNSFTFHGSVSTLTLSSHDYMVAIGGTSNIISRWNYSTGVIIDEIELDDRTGTVFALAFSPDGKILATPEYPHGRILLWDFTDPVLKTLKSDKINVFFCMTFSPDGSFLASGGMDGTIYYWNVDSEKLEKTFGPQKDMVMGIAFSPDGKTIVAGYYDGAVILWDVYSSQKILTFEGHTGSIAGVVFSPDGQTIASGSLDNSVILWDTSTGKQIDKIIADDKITSIAFSPDGRVVAFSDPIQINLWNLNKKEIVATFDGHQETVNALVFSPDGKKLISGSEDTTVRVWDLAGSGD